MKYNTMTPVAALVAFAVTASTATAEPGVCYTKSDATLMFMYHSDAKKFNDFFLEHDLEKAQILSANFVKEKLSAGEVTFIKKNVKAITINVSVEDGVVECKIGDIRGYISVMQLETEKPDNDAFVAKMKFSAPIFPSLDALYEFLKKCAEHEDDHSKVEEYIIANKRTILKAETKVEVLSVDVEKAIVKIKVVATGEIGYVLLDWTERA